MAQHTSNRYLYNSKEEQTTGSVGLLDYGARMYDATLGIWRGVDILAEERFSQSPFTFNSNNPVNRIDLNGMIDSHWNNMIDPFYLNLFSGEIEKSEEEIDNPFDQGLIKLADDTNEDGSNTTMEDIENALISKGYDYVRTNSVTGGFAVNTKSARKGWIMMNVINGETFGAVAGLASVGGVASRARNGISGLGTGSRSVGQGFKSFAAFKRAMGSAGKGKHWHHITEQTNGNIAKFGNKKIHNTNNLIKLPEKFHETISGYYSSKNSSITGSSILTIRQWLSTKSYEFQYNFGIQTLKRFGWTF